MKKTTAIQDTSILEKLRDGSGENNNSSFNFIPVVSVSNDKEETKDSKTGEVTGEKLKKKEFLITNRIDNEYVKESFLEEFQGVILKIKYRVDKKYEKVSTMPYFRSYEFNSFQGNNPITLKSGDNTQTFNSYKEFKEVLSDKYVLWSVVYMLVEDKCYKLEVKGNSRSAIWDYMQTFKNNDSISAHLTNFRLKVEIKPQAHHVLEVNVAEDDKVDIDKVLEFQEEIKSFNSAKTNVEVVSQEEVEVGTAPFK